MNKDEYYGWDGPGPRGTRNRKLKDEMKANQTMLSSLLSVSGLAAKMLPDLNVRSHKEIPNAARFLEPYDEELYARSGAITDAAIAAGTDTEKLMEVKRLTDSFLEDAEKILQREGLFRTLLVPGWLLPVYPARCFALWTLCGLGVMGIIDEAVNNRRAIVHENLRGCVHDATNGHALYGMTMASNPRINEGKIVCLMWRGKALRALQHLDAAETDFRAVCASIRAEGDTWTHKPSIQEATDNLLRCLVEKKSRDQTPRPHYTKPERQSLERELGIGLYSKSLYKCANCSAQRTTNSSVTLRLCTKCRQRWFCGNDCIREAWYSFHKQECKKLRECLGSFSTMNDEQVTHARELIERYGYISISSRDFSTGAIYVMWDPEKEEYFDSVTDGKVELTTVPRFYANLDR